MKTPMLPGSLRDKSAEITRDSRDALSPPDRRHPSNRSVVYCRRNASLLADILA
jgi:hypothetical protein